MKPIAKILVPVTGSARDRVALETAIELASPFASHVQALFTWPDPRSALPQIGVPFSTEVIEAVCNGQAVQAQKSENSAHALLAQLCIENGVDLLDRPGPGKSVNCSMRRETGSLANVLSHAAQFSDLVVFPPLRLPGFVDIIEAFLSVLTRIQRPVVVASEIVPKRPIDFAAIAWNGSKAAARAVMAAMPFLERSRKIFLLEAAESHARPCTDAIEQYLALHGITAVRKAVRLGPPSLGETLAHEAAEWGADILVMGGYGHSHLRESFFGGVTADALSRAAIPLFLAH